MGELEEIKKPLQKVIDKIRLNKKIIIASIWDKEFKQYSKHTRLVGLERGKLKVYVDSPVWMHELTLHKKHIINRINKCLDKDAISDIQFMIGEISNNYSR